MTIKTAVSYVTLILLVFSIFSYFHLGKLNKEDIRICKAVYDDKSTQPTRVMLLKYHRTDNKCCSFDLEQNRFIKKCRKII